MVAIEFPAHLHVTRDGNIQVRGTTKAGVEKLELNGVEINNANGSFETNVALSAGYNSITIEATNTEGRSSSATVDVIMDTEPPIVTIDSHTAGQIVTQRSLTVTGLIHDQFRGAINSDEGFSVVVNGVQANIVNGTYIAFDVPLSTSNILEVIAKDSVGNENTAQVSVIWEMATGTRTVYVSGQGQKGAVIDELAAPLVVRVQDLIGTPLANQTVIFKVSRGSGLLENGKRTMSVTTGADGLAASKFTLGSRAGAGAHRVLASTVGNTEQVEFFADAQTGTASRLAINAGNNQVGVLGEQLTYPLVVTAFDDNGNPVPNQPIIFDVVEGVAEFSNNTAQIEVETNASGKAATQLTLLNGIGKDVYKVDASLKGRAAQATFSASAVIKGKAENTRVVGLVVNNQDEPLKGVTAIIKGTTLSAVTDEQGQFEIENAPVGVFALIIDGTSADAEGPWPKLMYHMHTIAGVDNALPMPVSLVKMSENAVDVGHEDVVFSVPELPGFKLDVKKDSVTFPDGSKTGKIAVTAVNASKVPMTPPNDMQPGLVVTIQPADTKFNPPARMTVPNTDGYAPGAQVDLYSFDHDLEEFVSIGVGTVSEDGQVIKSNPGVGVVKAGWHGNLANRDTGKVKGCGNSCASDVSEDDSGEPRFCGGNPINIANGNKYQHEVDYVGAGPFPLRFERFYNSASGRWSHSHDYQGLYWGNDGRLTISLPTGRRITLYSNALPSAMGEEGRFDSRTDPYLFATLVYDTDQSGLVKLHQGDGSVYEFILNAGPPTIGRFGLEYRSGPLVIKKVVNPDGFSHYYDVPNNHEFLDEYVIQVRDDFGNSLSIDHITGFTDSNNIIYPGSYATKLTVGDVIFAYEYDDKPVITKVIYPDLTHKSYLYEDERYKTALTGIVDQDGKRFASWSYDNKKRARESFHGQRKDLAKLKRTRVSDKNASTKIETVLDTNNLGKQTEYTVHTRNHVEQFPLIERKATATCVASRTERTYYTRSELGLGDDSTSFTDKVKTETLDDVTTEYTYNSRGLPTSIVRAKGLPEETETVMSWHDTLYKPTRIQRGRQVITFAYDANGLLESATENNTRTTLYSYYDNRLLKSIDGPRTDVVDVTQFIYDANANLIRVIDAIGLETEMLDHNHLGQPRRIINPNDVETLLTYTAQGWLESRTVKSAQGDQVSTVEYWPYGLPKKVTAPNGSTISYEYNAARHLTAVENNVGERVEFSVDTEGNPIAQHIKNGDGATLYSQVQLFNELSELVGTISAEGQAPRFTYNAQGQPLTRTTGNQNSYTNTYDALYRLKTISDPLKGLMELSYDEDGNLDGVKDQRQLETRYTYNAFGEVEKLESPDTGVSTFSYDNAGNLLTRDDNGGDRQVSYTYDAANRMRSMSFAKEASLNTTFNYDQYTTTGEINFGRGRLTAITDNTGTTNYRYDDRGNLISESIMQSVAGQQRAYTTVYHYNLADQLERIDYPTGVSIIQGYNTLGQVNDIRVEQGSGAQQVSQSIVEQVQYLPYGRIQSLQWGNGLALSRQFDQSYRIQRQTVAGVHDWSYEYDGDDNITAINDQLDALQTQNFGYDALGRLIYEARNSESKDYVYDEIGNRLSRTAKDTSKAQEEITAIQKLTYAQASNRLINADGISYQYDTQGNLINDGELEYHYNQANRLARVTRKGTFVATYQYHSDGSRRLKELADRSIAYHYDQQKRLIGETVYDLTGTLLSRKSYVWLGLNPVGYVVENAGTGLEYYFVQFDEKFTPKSVLNASQEVVWERRFDAFGVSNFIDGIEFNIRFPGQYADAESGSEYNFFRDYSADKGRYLQSDPIGLEGGLDTYIYSSGNPVFKFDLLGLKPGRLDLVAKIESISKCVKSMTSAQNKYSVLGDYYAGAESLFRDLARVEFHVNSLNGEFGIYEQEKAFRAEELIGGAFKLYWESGFVFDGVNSIVFESIMNNLVFIAGRQTAQTGGVAVVGLMTGGIGAGAAWSGALTYSAYGRILNMIDRGIFEPIELLSGGLSGLSSYIEKCSCQSGGAGATSQEVGASLGVGVLQGGSPYPGKFPLK